MAMQWNDQQRKAIETTHANVLVSASAGAGKTTVLVARLMKRILKDHISVEHILAMTFTEAAAAEMKKRLLVSLSERQSNTTSESEREYCANQLIFLKSAHISTIHFFCLWLVKNNYASIQLNPARVANIFDDASVRAFQEEAWQYAKKTMLTEKQEQYDLLADSFSGRSESDAEVKKAVFRLMKQAQGSFDPALWLERIKEVYTSAVRFSDINPVILHYFFSYCAVQAEQLTSQLQLMMNCLQDQYPSEEKAISAVQLMMDKSALLQDAVNKQDYREYRRIMLNTLTTKTVNVKGAEDFKELRNELNKLAKTIAASLYEEETLLEDHNAMLPIAETLSETVQLMMRRFSEVKAEKQGIDFDDMEHFAYQILTANDFEVSKKIKEQFEEVMVDEFQDTNEVQNAILQLVCRDDNLFCVGDVKQSIYKFRGAKPQIMQDMIDSVNEADIKVSLSNNYRSKSDIVHFNNILFEKLMNLPGTSSRYAQEDMVECGTDAQFQNPFSVEFHGLHLESFQNSQDEDEPSQAKEIKAWHIAAEIASMKQAGEFSHYKDYVVLLRSHQDKRYLKQAFTQYGIPFFIEDKAGFYQSEAIQGILSLLHLFLDPSDDISAAGFLSSPLAGCSDEELAELYLTKDKASLYFAWARDNKELSRKTEYLRTHYESLSLPELLNQIFCLRDYIFETADSQQKSNCDLLYEKANRFQNEQGSSLFAFLEYIHQAEDAQTSEAMPVGNEEDVVRVMTIHHSKGLQFPVVFFWSNSRLDIQEKKESCLIDSECTAGLFRTVLPQRIRRKTLNRIAIEQKMIMEELEENIRILYVALTRAQNRMILVDTVKDSYTPHALSFNTLMAKKGFSDLVLSAMRDSHKTFRYIELSNIKKPTYHALAAEKELILPIYNKMTEEIKVSSPSSDKSFYLDELRFSDAAQGTDRGTLIHQALETLPMRRWTAEELHAIVSNLSLNDQRGLQAWNESELFKKLCTMNTTAEYGFIVQLSPETISQGYIDLIGYSDEEVIIVDFKSDIHITEETLRERYSNQLLAYLDACGQLFPDKMIHSFIYSLELQRVIEIIPDSNKLKA